MTIRDDTRIVQDAIEAAVAGGRPAILLNREYWVRKTIVVPPCEGLEFGGLNQYRTRIVWKGGSGSVLFDRANSRDHLWRNLTIDVQAPLDVAVLDINRNYPVGHAQHDPALPIPSNNRHERILVRGNGRLAHYRHYKVGQCDENNEHHVDVDVRVAETAIGWRIEGQQSKYHEMVRCYFDGGRDSLHAVLSSGSFSWLGGGGYGAAGAFFSIENQTDTVAIHRADVDGSQRFLMATGPKGRTGTSQPIEVAGGRFMTHRLAPDGEAIVCETSGPLSVHHFQLGSGAQPVGKILMCGFRGALDVRNCAFGAFGSAPDSSIEWVSGVIANTGPNNYTRPDGESYTV